MNRQSLRPVRRPVSAEWMICLLVSHPCQIFAVLFSLGFLVSPPPSGLGAFALLRLKRADGLSAF